MRSPSRRLAAIFKPQDEEAYAPNNPKDYTDGTGEMRIKTGIPPGGTAIRECAAYVLDRHAPLSLCANVPATTMATACHPNFKQATDTHVLKRGSLQEYCCHQCSAEDISSSKFTQHSVQTIAMLDIRTFNQDRHAGNMLVRLENTAARTRSHSMLVLSEEEKETSVPPVRSNSMVELSDEHYGLPRRASYNSFELEELIPIDHGCILPHYHLMEETTFEWLFWPQSKIAFTEEQCEAIASLTVWDDIVRLENELGMRLEPEAIVSLHIGTLVLQLGAKANRTLCEMGQWSVREDLDVPSMLETLIEKHQYLLQDGFEKRKVVHFLKALEGDLVSYIHASRRLRHSNTV